MSFRFHYASVWSRLIACLAIANVVWYAVGGPALEIIERILYDALLAAPIYGSPFLPSPVDTILVYVMCLLPALVRVERPLALVGCGLAMAAGYGLFYLAVLFWAELMPPLAGPLFGLAISVIVLGAMAWSGERARRKELDLMEAAKQRFTDMLVHDLKSRVSSLRISLSLLAREHPAPDEKARTLFDAMNASSARMLLQINALLDIRKMQEGRLELQRQRLTMASVLRDALREHGAVADLCGVALHHAEQPEANALVDVDPELFSRVLANLLWNALRSSPRGSTVEVTLDRAGHRVALSVSNAGTVITAAEQAELFQPFVSHVHRVNSLSSSGTGLGLAFCKLAVEAHGGTIELQSPRMPEGDGVRVTLHLPVAAG